MTPTPTSPVPHSRWMSFFHALGVIAPVAAAAFSIYSGSPADALKAQQTAELIAAVVSALSGQSQQQPPV